MVVRPFPPILTLSSPFRCSALLQLGVKWILLQHEVLMISLSHPELRTWAFWSLEAKMTGCTGALHQLRQSLTVRNFERCWPSTFVHKAVSSQDRIVLRAPRLCGVRQPTPDLGVAFIHSFEAIKAA